MEIRLSLSAIKKEVWDGMKTIIGFKKKDGNVMMVKTDRV